MPGLFAHRILSDFSDYQSIASEAMRSRIEARNHAGDIDTGHGRKNRVVIPERYSVGGEHRKIGHQPGIDLRRLESVKNEHHYG